MQTPKEPNRETKKKRYTFSLVSDTDVENPVFSMLSSNSLTTFNFSQLLEQFL